MAEKRLKESKFINCQWQFGCQKVLQNMQKTEIVNKNSSETWQDQVSILESTEDWNQANSRRGLLRLLTRVSIVGSEISGDKNMYRFTWHL